MHVYIVELFTPIGQYAFVSNGFAGIYEGLNCIGGFKATTFDLSKSLEKKTYEFSLVVSDDPNFSNLRYMLSTSRCLSEVTVRYSLFSAGKIRPLLYASVTKVEYNDREFKIITDSFISRLHYTKIVKTSSVCRWEFGSTECGINLTTVRDSLTISSFASNRLSVEIQGGMIEGKYLNGYLEFNDLIQTVRFDIATNNQTTIYLWDEIPIEIFEGNVLVGCKAYRGCKKDYDTCRNIYNNIVNFGAIPTRDNGANWIITTSKVLSGTKEIS
jgi:uncharacterized phage protein (TIGR02218 family)